MTENPNAVTTPVDSDAEARPGDATRTSRPAPVGHPARDDAVKSVEHGDLPASPPPPCPSRRDGRQHRVRLRSGDWVWVRQLRPGDGPALAAFVERLSSLSRYRRFHSAVPRLTEQMIGYLTDIDHHDHEALVAVPAGTGGMIVGVARFIRDPAHPDTAEVAVVVADSWQRRGLGTLLLRRLAGRASEVGISSVTGDILAENHPTIGLARRLGARSMDNHGSTVTTRMDLAQCPAGDTDAGPLGALVAAEVVLVPRLIQPMLDWSVDLIRTLVAPVTHITWPTPQLTHRRAWSASRSLPRRRSTTDCENSLIGPPDLTQAAIQYMGTNEPHGGIASPGSGRRALYRDAEPAEHRGPCWAAAIGRHSRGREHDTDYEVIIREALADLVEHPENCRCVRRPRRRRGRRR